MNLNQQNITVLNMLYSKGGISVCLCVYERVCVSVYACFKVRIGFLSSWSVGNGHQV